MRARAPAPPSDGWDAAQYLPAVLSSTHALGHDVSERRGRPNSRQLTDWPRTARMTKLITRSTRKSRKKILAIPAEAPANPTKPKTPATTARRKKIRAQPS